MNLLHEGELIPATSLVVRKELCNGFMATRFLVSTSCHSQRESKRDVGLVHKPVSLQIM